PSSDDLPLPALFSADKRYPLERLSSEMYMLDPNPGMTPGDMIQTPLTPSERLEGLRAIWPNVNVWSDAAPLLTGDFGRLAPGPVAGLRPDGDKHVAKSNTDFEWAALNSKIAVRDRDTLLDPSRRSTWETDETVKMPVAGPLFLFGQLGASTPAVEEQQHKWLGRTGVGLKLKPWFLEEVHIPAAPPLRSHP